MLLVTRPGPEGPRLAALLRRAGCDALWWPAFDLRGEPDAQAIQAISDPGSFDLVVFVSPEAVRAAARILAATGAAGHGPRLPWPAHCVAAVTGAGTGRLLEAGFDIAQAVLAPAAGTGGAEALWERIREALAGGGALSARSRGGRALIIRADHGRELLGERLAQAGMTVQTVCAYRRLAHEPGAAPIAALRAGSRGARVRALLYSSSEAVPEVLGQLGRLDPEGKWTDALALCLHPRIAQAAASHGHGSIRLCEPQAQAVLQALREDAAGVPPPAAHAV